METEKKTDLKLHTIGNYNVRNIILGKGNFATVYFAVHNLVGTAVALKVIDKREIKEEYVLKNLERESRILIKLKHQNIVKLYETLKSDDFFCLSLELVKGVSMSEYLKTQPQRRVPEARCRPLFFQMLSGVQHMHAAAVIHRDLKLENLMIENECVIKIVDFGLSNVYYPCKRLRTHCGSVEYAAPELFHSRSPYSTAVDMWSLGVVLYAMVVGRMPFPYPRNSSSVHSRRQTLLALISKGLNQHNRECMKNLSCECWNLLHSLLEPDQFKRMTLDVAIAHVWFTSDVHLKSLLPRNPARIYKHFHQEVITYLSKTQHLPEDYVENHIRTYKEDDLAAMYNIISDTLAKDALFPQKVRENSYIHRFRQRMESLKKEEKLRKGLKLRWKDEASTTESQISNLSASASGQVTDSRRSVFHDGIRRVIESDHVKRSVPATTKVEQIAVYRIATPNTRIPRHVANMVPQPEVHQVAVKSYKASRPVNVKSTRPSGVQKASHGPIQAKPDTEASSNFKKTVYSNTIQPSKKHPNPEINRKNLTKTILAVKERRESTKDTPYQSVVNSVADEASSSNMEFCRNFRNPYVQSRTFSHRDLDKKPEEAQKSIEISNSKTGYEYGPKKVTELRSKRMVRTNSPFPMSIAQASGSRPCTADKREVIIKSMEHPSSFHTPTGDSQKSKVPLVKSRVPRFLDLNQQKDIDRGSPSTLKAKTSQRSIVAASNCGESLRRAAVTNVKYGAPTPGFGTPAVSRVSGSGFVPVSKVAIGLQQGDGHLTPTRAFAPSRVHHGVTSKIWKK